MSTYSIPDLPALSDGAFADFRALFAETSRIGATAAGGLHRLAASKEDGDVRDLLCAWLQVRGFEVRVDGIGNIFGLLTFDPAAPYVLCGSHLDSQPSAGRFDGVYGVLSAAVCAANLAIDYKDKVARGKTPPRNLCIVNWTNEEGARFQPSLTGSSVFTGAMTLEKALACEDAQGMSLGDALTQIGYRGSDVPPIDIAAYLEIHVEQGRGLEQQDLAVGIVRETWAALKWRVAFEGEQNHTGPTPMADRRDALLAAAHAIIAVREEAQKHGLDMHSSVGKLDIYPNSPNVVPSRTTMLVEFRSRDVERLQQAAERFQQSLQHIATQTGTRFHIEDKQLRSPLQLHGDLSDLAFDTARALGLPVGDSVTVAGHDAISMSRHYPTCLVFIPSRNGLSHNEAEYTADADLANGLRLLHALLHRTCHADLSADTASLSTARSSTRPATTQATSTANEGGAR